MCHEYRHIVSPATIYIIICVGATIYVVTAPCRLVDLDCMHCLHPLQTLWRWETEHISEVQVQLNFTSNPNEKVHNCYIKFFFYFTINTCHNNIIIYLSLRTGLYRRYCAMIASNRWANVGVVGNMS